MKEGFAGGGIEREALPAFGAFPAVRFIVTLEKALRAKEVPARESNVWSWRPTNWAGGAVGT